MDSSLLQRLGQAFRKRREALGYSQESFADHIGMHRTYYSAIERGEKNLQIDICNACRWGWKPRCGSASRKLKQASRVLVRFGSRPFERPALRYPAPAVLGA